MKLTVLYFTVDAAFEDGDGFVEVAAPEGLRVGCCVLLRNVRLTEQDVGSYENTKCYNSDEDKNSFHFFPIGVSVVAVIYFS